MERPTPQLQLETSRPPILKTDCAGNIARVQSETPSRQSDPSALLGHLPNEGSKTSRHSQSG